MPLNLNQIERALPRALFSSFLIVLTAFLASSYLWSVQSNIIPSANHEIVYFFAYSIFLLFYCRSTRFDTSLILFISAILIQYSLIEDSEYFIVFFCFSSYIFLSYQCGLAQAANKKSNSAINIILASILIAGSLSAMIVFYQKFLGDSHESINLWTLPLNSPRAYANLAQPNHASTLICSSLLIIAFALPLHRSRTGKYSIIALIIILSLAIFWTGSRTGFLILFLAPFFAKASKVNREILLRSSVGIATIIMALLLQSIFNTQATNPFDRGGSFGRYLLWSMALDLIADKPFLGHGYGSTIEKFSEILLNKPIVNFQENSVPSSSHNILLDTTIYFGIPFATIFFAYFALIFVQKLKKGFDKLQVTAFFAAFPILIHSLLEFPLNYTYFAFPFFFLIGYSISGSYATPHKSTIFFYASRLFVLIVFLLSFTYSVAIIRNYQYIALSFNKLKLEASGIILQNPYKWNDNCILQSYCDFLNIHTISPEKYKEYADLINKVAKNHPTPRSLQLKIINLLYIQKDIKEAEKMMRFYDLIYTPIGGESISKKFPKPMTTS